MRPTPETTELIFCLSRSIFSKRCVFVVAPLFFLLPDTRTCAAFALRSLQKQRCAAFRATTIPPSLYRWAGESYYQRVHPNFYRDLCSSIFSTRLLPRADQAEKGSRAVLGINGDGVSPLEPEDDQPERGSHFTSAERGDEYAPHDIRGEWCIVERSTFYTESTPVFHVLTRIFPRGTHTIVMKTAS